jgi:hypothetical protein
MKIPIKFYPFKLLATAIFFIVFHVHVSAQSIIDCKKLLNQEINPEVPQQIIDNIKRTECFGLDSVDLKVFANGPVLGSLLVKKVSKNKDGKVTYQDLLSEINQIKSDTSYLTVRNRIVAMNTLEATKATPSTWERSKKLLKVIGTSENETEKLYEFMLKNQAQNWNYRQLVVIYEQKEKAAKTRQDKNIVPSNTNDIKNLKSLYSKYCDTGRLIKFGENLVAFKDYLYGLECAKKMHMASLIFFNAYHSINSRRLESLITYNPQINSYLKENFIIINLIVDDKTAMPNSSKTVGETNSNLETEKFKADYQPFVVIIDEHNNIKRSMSSSYDSNTFLNFLIKQD